MFIFLLVLAVSEFVCVFAFSFWLAPILFLGAVASKTTKKLPDFFVWPFMAVSWMWQLYFWATWAAISFLIAAHFVQTTETFHGWIYYLFALVSSAVPLGYLANAEDRANGVRPGEGGASKGAAIYSFFTIVVFVVYWIWPQALKLPLWWLK